MRILLATLLIGCAASLPAGEWVHPFLAPAESLSSPEVQVPSVDVPPVAQQAPTTKPAGSHSTAGAPPSTPATSREPGRGDAAARPVSPARPLGSIVRGDTIVWWYSNGTTREESKSEYRARTGKSVDLCCSTGFCTHHAGFPKTPTAGCQCGCRAAECSCPHSPTVPSDLKTSKRTKPAILTHRQGFPWISRIQTWDRDGATSWGSGSLVHEQDGVAYVLTAKHVTRDRLPGKRAVMAHFPGGIARWAVVERVHPTEDAVLLRIAETGIQPAVIRDGEPATGELLYSAGYGGNGYVAFARGICHHRSFNLKTGQPYVTLRGKGSRQGDSGGPVLDARGRFVGVQWGGGGRGTESIGSRLGVAWELLSRVTETPSHWPREGTPVGLLRSRASVGMPDVPAAAGVGPSLPSQFYNLPAAGCAGGQCTVQGRRGLFGRRR